MVDVNAINLLFTVKASDKNINMLKRLFKDGYIDSLDEEDDIVIGEEITLNFCFEGELDDSVVTMAMLFNGDLIGKPLIKVSRVEIND